MTTTPLPLDGSFEAHADGTTADVSAGIVDNTAFAPWRLYDVAPGVITHFAGTIIPTTDTNSGAGSHAIRLDTTKVGTGGGYAFDVDPPSNWPKVSDKVPFYVFSFDAAWISGDNNRLGVILAEFDSSTAFITQPVLRLSVTDTSYKTFRYLYTPDAGTAYLVPEFSPILEQTGTSSLSLDNVKLEVPATLPPNGTFEYSPMGATSTSGTGGNIDGATFLGWRLFSVGGPAINGFTGTIVDAGSYAGGTPGSHAMRLDIEVLQELPGEFSLGLFEGREGRSF